MRPETLIDLIGEADDKYVADADKKKRLPKWIKYITAAAACVCIAAVGGFFALNLGGNSGSGGDSDLEYMFYTGPVLPMTADGDSSGITAVRKIDFDFTPYISVERSYTDYKGNLKTYMYAHSESLITDSYTLTNNGKEDKAVSLLYPFSGMVKNTEYFPVVYVNDERAETSVVSGPYSANMGIEELNSFEDYESVLSDGSYLASAFSELPDLNVPVIVYKISDYVYSKSENSSNPTLCFKYNIDFQKTYTFCYNISGGVFDYDAGFIERTKSSIKHNPDADKNHQHPGDAYIIVLGEDISNFTVQGYKDGSCESGSELDDLSCAVTRYESTLGDIIYELASHYMEEINHAGDDINYDIFEPSSELSAELLCDLSAEMLDMYGWLGDFPVKRYDSGSIEDIFSMALNDWRVNYLTFNITVPHGSSVTVDIKAYKEASMDYIGEDKDKDGYSLATTLGSHLKITEQTASVSNYDEIRIVNQNFGFDLNKGIVSVKLDNEIPHYWLEVEKIFKD